MGTRADALADRIEQGAVARGDRPTAPEHQGRDHALHHLAKIKAALKR